MDLLEESQSGSENDTTSSEDESYASAVSEFSDSEEEEYDQEEVAQMIGNLQPYQYEPERDSEGDESSGSESDLDINDILPDKIIAEEEDPDRRAGNKKWCTCGHCKKELYEIDCLCCQEEPAISEDKFEGHGCITFAQMFKTLCLEKQVLKNVLIGLHETRGDPIEKKDGVFINKAIRFASYRQFIWWIFERLQRHDRRVIPSCVLWQIRKLYPEVGGRYVRFKYGRVDID